MFSHLIFRMEKRSTCPVKVLPLHMRSLLSPLSLAFRQRRGCGVQARKASPPCSFIARRGMNGVGLAHLIYRRLISPPRLSTSLSFSSSPYSVCLSPLLYALSSLQIPLASSFFSLFLILTPLASSAAGIRPLAAPLPFSPAPTPRLFDITLAEGAARRCLIFVGPRAAGKAAVLLFSDNGAAAVTWELADVWEAMSCSPNPRVPSPSAAPPKNGSIALLVPWPTARKGFPPPLNHSPLIPPDTRF